MMAGDQPLVTIPLVRKGVSGFHAGPGFLKPEGVEPRIDRRVAIDLDFTRVNAPHWVVLEKMVEVVLLVKG